MKLYALSLFLLLVPIELLSAHSPTLLLMGGSYKTCSSLDTDDCLADKKDFSNARQAAKYQIDQRAFLSILAPSYWATRHQPPALSKIKQLLESSYSQASNRTLSYAELNSIFEQADSSTWNALLVSEQDMIFSAFEMPQFANGSRLKEGVALDGGNRPFDAQMFRRFVQEAAKRSPGKKPRIAFVTSAAANNFDAVDFYRELFQQAGAEVIWWPIDASMNAAIYGHQGCVALPRLRQQIFSQLNREGVFPDLNKQQQQACLNANQLANVPMQVQAIFLDGGDQWLHWNTFFTADGHANPWLQNLRTAFKTGNLVVAGTSAGTAVQSGPAMITNGTSANALKIGAKIYGSMDEGCERAKRCPLGFEEDDLSYWPGGGLSLAGPLLMDTHVSERKRELRLLTLLNAVDAVAGIGVDETSAVLLNINASDISVEALGMSGAWWMMKPTAGPTRGEFSLQAHYLAPGNILHWQDGQLRDTAMPHFSPRAAKTTQASDAISGKGLRDAVWTMAINHQPNAELRAGKYRIDIHTDPESKYWQGPDGQQGITNLRIAVTQESHD
jgi:cyanophycinase-like exopeptidase